MWFTAPRTVRFHPLASPVGLGLQQKLALSEKTKDTKKNAHRRYQDAVLALSKAFALASASDEAREIREEVGFFQAIRAALVKSSTGSGVTQQERELAIQQIVGRRRPRFLDIGHEGHRTCDSCERRVREDGLAERAGAREAHQDHWRCVVDCRRQIFTTVAIRADGDPLELANAVRAAIWRVDKDQPVWGVTSIERIVDGAVGSPRLIVRLSLARSCDWSCSMECG